MCRLLTWNAKLKMAQHNQFDYFRGPVGISFAGFRSDTYTLQKAGWQVAQVIDDYGNSIRLTLLNEDLGLAAQSESMQLDRYRNLDGIGGGYTLRIVKMASKGRIQVFKDFSTGSLVDCTPMMATVADAYGDWAVFGPPVGKTLEVLVEPSSVSECLDLIQKLQSPKLAAIRAEGRERDLRTAYTQHINAKIMSVA